MTAITIAVIITIVTIITIKQQPAVAYRTGRDRIENLMHH
jgi:hypothetical protein